MAIPIPDFLVLNPRLAAKLAAVVVHSYEMLSSSGHAFDKAALEQCCRDPEVQDWVQRCGPLAPLKRG